MSSSGCWTKALLSPAISRSSSWTLSCFPYKSAWSSARWTRPKRWAWIGGSIIPFFAARLRTRNWKPLWPGSTRGWAGWRLPRRRRRSRPEVLWPRAGRSGRGIRTSARLSPKRAYLPVQHLRQHRPIHISARKHRRHPLAAQPVALLQDRRHRRRARALRHIVRVVEYRPHGRRHLVVVHHRHARNVRAHYFQRPCIGSRHRHPIRQPRPRRRHHHFAPRERFVVRPRVRRHHPHNLRLHPQRRPRRAHPQNPRPHADRHKRHVDCLHRAEQFPRIRRRPLPQPLVKRRHVVVPLRLRPAVSLLPRLLEILSVLHQPGAQRSHRPILPRTVAVRHIHHRVHPFAPRRERHRLPEVPARGRYRHPRRAARFPQSPEIHQAAADLEGPQRPVILVLHPDLAPRPLTQQGPAILRRGRHRLIHNLACVFDFLPRRKGHSSPTFIFFVPANAITYENSTGVARTSNATVKLQKVARATPRGHNSFLAGQQALHVGWY